MDHPYLNVSDPDFTRRLHHVTYGVVAPLLVATGLAGNLVCLPCLVAPKRWGVTRFFLVALSSVDTTIMLCMIPTLVRLAAPTALLSSHALAVYAAHVEQFLLTATTCGSIGTVVALTVDRYISVCLHMEFKRQHQHAVARRRVAFALGLAVAVAVPACFRGSTLAEPGGWRAEQAGSAGWRGYIVFCECVTRLLPMLVLVALNWRVATGFREMLARAAQLAPSPYAQREVSVASMPERSALPEAAEERALIRLVVAITVCLIVGLLPGAVTTVCLMFAGQASTALDVAVAAANLLEIANFSTNYVFYLLFNKRLRMSLIDFYKNLFKRKYPPIAINDA